MRDIDSNSTITLVWLMKPEKAERKYFSLAARAQGKSMTTTSAVKRMQTLNCNKPQTSFVSSEADGLDFITLTYRSRPSSLSFQGTTGYRSLRGAVDSL
jgi:hypothetical protein